MVAIEQVEQKPPVFCSTKYFVKIKEKSTKKGLKNSKMLYVKVCGML